MNASPTGLNNVARSPIKMPVTIPAMRLMTTPEVKLIRFAMGQLSFLRIIIRDLNQAHNSTTIVKCD